MGVYGKAGKNMPVFFAGFLKTPQQKMNAGEGGFRGVGCRMKTEEKEKMPPKKMNVQISVIKADQADIRGSGIFCRGIVDLSRLCEKSLASEAMDAKLLEIVQETEDYCEEEDGDVEDRDEDGDGDATSRRIELWRKMLFDFLKHLKQRVADGETSITIEVDDEGYKHRFVAKPYEFFGRVYKHGRYRCSIQHEPYFFLDVLETWMKASTSPCVPCAGFKGSLVATVDVVYLYG